MKKNNFTPYKILIFLVLILTAQIFTPANTIAWKPYTHNYTGNEVFKVIQNSNDVDINGLPYEVHQEVLEAIRQYPECYYAGTVGPDGFPDLTYGQMILHPKKTGEWLSYLLQEAWNAQDSTAYTNREKAQILAFTYGFMSHCAGDVWGHTLINEFAGGAWPEELFTIDGASTAIRHLLVEGYIADATPGFDSNPEFGNAPNNDWSDDSTPGYPYDVPKKFIYNAMIDREAQTPVKIKDENGNIDYIEARGALIGSFMECSDELDELRDGMDGFSLSVILDEYDETVAAFDSMVNECEDFWKFWEWDDCIESFGEFLGDLVFDTIEAFEEFVYQTTEELASNILGAYLAAWRDDIEDGLKDWGDFGLAMANGLFDAQTRRDLQNYKCKHETGAHREICEAGIGTLDVVMNESEDYMQNHLLSMLGLPDAAGRIWEAIETFNDEILKPILELLEIPFNPIQAGIDEIKERIKEKIKEAIKSKTGFDIDEFQEQFKDPSSRLCNTEWDVTFPQGQVTVPLFQSSDHERVDNIMGIGLNDHENNEICQNLKDSAEYNPDSFYPIRNTITLMKMLLLEPDELNNLLADAVSGVVPGEIPSWYRIIGTYRSFPTKVDDNVMTKIFTENPEKPFWLMTIDGDHAWREDGKPVFDVNELRPEDTRGGTGNFPIWESCVLRKAFRRIFRDWENDSSNFPDLGDYTSADSNNDPAAPVSSLTFAGTEYNDEKGNKFIGGDNSFTITAHDTPDNYAFKDDELALQYRVYKDNNKGAFIDINQGYVFSIMGEDGTYNIDFRSSDPCHDFEEEPLPSKNKKLVILDTTPPVITCSKPPFGLSFESGDVSTLMFKTDDGENSSGLADSSSSIDGYFNSPEGMSIEKGSELDMYLYYPGTRTVTITAADNIGNTDTKTCTFEIHATAKSLINNVNRAVREDKIKDPGISKALLKKLKNADKAHKKGKIKTEINILRAFINLIIDQRGTHINEETADRFIAYTEDLINIRLNE